MTTTIAELADQLVAGHDGGPLISSVPEALIPQDRKDIFALQDAVIARLGAVGGWKIAAGSGPEPMCAPVPQNRYFADGARLDGAHHRFVIAEVEVALTLARDLPAGAGLAEAEAAIGTIHPALEMVGSPFVDRDAMPRNLQLGDLQSNGAIILGPAIDGDTRAALATLDVTLTHDGAAVHVVTKGASWTETVEAVAWLSGHAASRNLPLTAGQVIITGARALFAIQGARTIVGQMGAFGSVSCQI